MSVIPIEPGQAARKPACAWCGLRISAGKHQGTDCCAECERGGRVFRLRMVAERWKRLRSAE